MTRTRGASIERRPPGKPRRRRREPAAWLLQELARKYVWWLSPAEVGARPDLTITQTMDIGDFEDHRRLDASLGYDRLAQALRGTATGRFSPRSWAYWHLMLDLSPEPPSRQRRFEP